MKLLPGRLASLLFDLKSDVALHDRIIVWYKRSHKEYWMSAPEELVGLHEEVRPVRGARQREQRFPI